MTEINNIKKKPGFMFSLALMIALCTVVITPYVLWRTNMAATFFLSYLFVIPACMSLGYSYQELEKAVFENASKVISSVFILLAVGGMVGTWIAAGTVSSIVYIGLQLITPKLFLLITFVIGSLYAIACGTSWGTLGTIGIAMSAVGTGLGVPPAMTAGAIVSAAFLGDGFSPMSDSPNLASAIAGVNVMDHVRHMAKIQIPVFVIGAAFYAAVGFGQSGSGQIHNETTDMIISTLSGNYHIGFIAFLPALAVLILLLLKKSAVISILISSITGVIVACIYQGAGLKTALECFWSGVKSNTGVGLVDTLLSRGGVTSLFSSAALYLITFGLIGILTKAGILDAVIEPLVNKVKSGFQLLITTIFTGFIGDAVGCSGSFAYIFTGNLLKPVYKKMNVSDLDLARNMGCSVTPLGPLIPWNVNAVIALDLLGVSCIQYAPYCVQAYLMPLMLIAFFVFRSKKTEEKSL